MITLWARDRLNGKHFETEGGSDPGDGSSAFCSVAAAELRST